MGRSVMISVKPRFCDLIAREKKKIEVRKTRPKTEIPFKCYIYCTRAKRSEKLYSNGTVIVKDTRKLLDPSVRYPGSKIFQRWNGKVIGEFICDTIITDHTFGHDPLFNALSCMNDAEIASYCTANEMYGWHISDLTIYDKPKDIDEFQKPCSHDCKNCKYWYSGSLIDYEPPYCEWEDYFITRPPQSWCYVESEVSE